MPGPYAYPENSRIIMNASPRLRLIHSQIFHFRCAEDNILVRLLYWGDELRWRPAKKFVLAARTHIKSGKLRVRRKATEKSTWGYALSDIRACSSFTSVILHHGSVELGNQALVPKTRWSAHRRDSVPMEYTARRSTPH